jgi:hypothetical protein
MIAPLALAIGATAPVLPAAADLKSPPCSPARPLPITGAAIPGTASVPLRTPLWRSVDDDARQQCVRT